MKVLFLLSFGLLFSLLAHADVGKCQANTDDSDTLDRGEYCDAIKYSENCQLEIDCTWKDNTPLAPESLASEVSESESL
jgi:hypothetical protein